MVHAADVALAVAQAGGDAGSQCGGGQQILIGDKLLTWQDLDGDVAKVGIPIKERCLTGLPRRGFEPGEPG